MTTRLGYVEKCEAECALGMAAMERVNFRDALANLVTASHALGCSHDPEVPIERFLAATKQVCDLQALILVGIGGLAALVELHSIKRPTSTEMV